MARMLVLIGRGAGTVLLVAVLVATGKTVEYAAVSAFGRRFGFDLPALASLVLYIGALHWFGRRRITRRLSLQRRPGTGEAVEAERPVTG